MSWIWLIPAAPLAGALLLLLGGRVFDRVAGHLAAGAVGIGFVAVVASWLAMIDLPVTERSQVLHLYQWAISGGLDIGVDLRWDPLSAVMAFVITGVGFLIHVYSIGYMRGDPRYRRFFAYLNLFVFSMLVLVLGDNLLLLFAGWELVGACSYLLIGFWTHRPSAATAAKKAFLVTRIGDTGLMIGLFLIFANVGTLQISEILVAVQDGAIGQTTMTVIALLLFCGAVGKSAQIPLYVWLPDAMEGPTPVSALIHAATMVTAGVYLVVRMGPLYEASTVAATVVAVVGVATALYAAILAMAEEDIKRVLAYSTVSQLGYMFLAAGVGVYSLAMFHLVTHAFFKALLFLAAGSVMHAMSGETSLERLGGLRRVMPWTFGVTAVGWIAITGILPFAGFFSKDAIVAVPFVEGRIGLFAVAVVGAGLTAFYMSRMLFMAFLGEARWPEGAHPHESPALMVVPMALLGVLSIIGGAINLPHGLPFEGMLSRFLDPVIAYHEHVEPIAVTAGLWVVVAVGIGIAWLIYGSRTVSRERLRDRLGPVFTLARNKFFVDEIYATVIVAPARLAAALFSYIDRRIVDGAVNGTAGVVAKAAGSWRVVQTGLVRTYAAAVFAGAAALIAYVVVRHL